VWFGGFYGEDAFWEAYLLRLQRNRSLLALERLLLPPRTHLCAGRFPPSILLISLMNYHFIPQVELHGALFLRRVLGGRLISEDDFLSDGVRLL